MMILSSNRRILSKAYASLSGFNVIENKHASMIRRPTRSLQNLMKTYKIVISVTDHDDIGLQQIKDIIEKTKYPNCCIHPHVMDVSDRYVKWSDNHPLNKHDTMMETFWKLFGGSGRVTPDFVDKLLTFKDDEMIEYLYDQVGGALAVHDFKSVDDMLMHVKPELFSTVILIAFLTVTNTAKHKLNNRRELFNKIYEELKKRHPDRVIRLMQGFD